MTDFFAAAEIVLKYRRKRIRDWWCALMRARQYAERARHRLRPVPSLPAPVDPWMAYAENSHSNRLLIIDQKEGPMRHVDISASVMGRNPNRPSSEPSTEEFVRTVEGWGDHHGQHRSHHRRRVQRPTARVQARFTTV